MNLPDAQKILLRVDPTLPMHEIKEQICKQKKYAHSNEYTLRLPNKIDHPLLLGLSLAEYKTNELTLVHLKQLDGGAKFPGNQLQSFDRLYRVRSESQPPKERPLEIPNEQQAAVNNNRLTNGANANRSLTLRPSHTTLHAYWNDPNFDTQSQLSNSSSTTKKRRAPRAPMCISPNRYDPQIVYVRQQQPFLNTHSPSPPPRHDHHQSCESLLSENARRKRKAPVVAATNSAERREEDARERVEQNQPINVANDVIRPGTIDSFDNGWCIFLHLGVHPPPPPTERKTGPSSVERPNGDYRSIIEINPKPIDETQRIDITIDPVDGQRLLNLLQTQTATSAKLVITTHVPEAAHIESSLPPPSPTEKNEELAPAETTTSATAIPSHTESEQVEWSLFFLRRVSILRTFRSLFWSMTQCPRLLWPSTLLKWNLLYPNHLVKVWPRRRSPPQSPAFCASSMITPNAHKSIKRRKSKNEKLKRTSRIFVSPKVVLANLKRKTRVSFTAPRLSSIHRRSKTNSREKFLFHPKHQQAQHNKN